MKLLLTISLGLLACSVQALCWPQGDDYPFDGQGMVEEQQDGDYGYLQQDDYEIPDEDAADEPMMELADGEQGEDATEQVRLLRSGCTVSMKLGCGRYVACKNTARCTSSSSPCAAARFRMYKAVGSGYICTGDFVTIQYPYRGSSTWFSLKNNVGQISTCIVPSSSSCLKWAQCHTAVFRVYARGKNIGAAIANNDIIALYHPDVDVKSFLKLGSYGVGRSQCLLKSLPPSTSVFDRCRADTAQLIIYD